MLVVGPAGSGKTLLAAEAARRHAAMGRRTWLLCFTKALAESLKRALPEVQVRTVAALALSLVGRVRGTAPPAAGRDATFWEDLYLEAAEAVQTLPESERPEAVVVDEAQDLTTGAWLLVDGLASTTGRLWAFGDPVQGFWPERKIPESAFPTRCTLPQSHRCPAGILALAGRFVGQPTDEAAIEAALADGTLGYEGCPSESAVPEYVGRTIDKLCSDGLRPEDVFVVSLRGQQAAGSILSCRSLGRYEPVRADHPEAAERLVADTFLRLKGLERPAVVVTDLRLLDEAPRGGEGARMYIALTRALLAARIVAPAAVLAAHPLLEV